MPWTSVFRTSREVDGFDGDLQSRVLRTMHDGPNGHKSKNFRDQQAEIQCSVQVKRKDDQPIEIKLMTFKTSSVC